MFTIQKGIIKSCLYILNNKREPPKKDGYLLNPYRMEIICLPADKPFLEFHSNGHTSYQLHKVIYRYLEKHGELSLHPRRHEWDMQEITG